MSSADPRFANPAAGDCHLTSGSPAVDHCADGPARDVDYDSRPMELRGTLTYYDAGADELPNLIFYDGFESGDTSRW